MASSKVAISAAPPTFLDPSKKPQFLVDSGIGIAYKARKEVPRAVVVAAAAALAKPHRDPIAMSLPPAHRDPDLQRRRGKHGPSTPRGKLALVPWPPPVGVGGKYEHFRLANEALALTADHGSEESDPSLVRFGDSIRILQQSDNAAISTVPPGCAIELENHLAHQFSASGREHQGVIAVTAVLPRESRQGSKSNLAVFPSRRNVWEVFRANPLDGYPDDVVHYGQLLRFGQSPGAAWPCHPGDQDEVLLSCEPPMSAGGADASYLLLGRASGFAHPHTADEKRTFDTTFRLLPLKGGGIHAPVDLREPVFLLPVSPAAYGHHPRSVHVSSGGHSHKKQVRTLEPLSAFGEFPLEASLINPHPASFSARKQQGLQYRQFNNNNTPPGWVIERVVICPGSIPECNRIRKQASEGLPRALLGRGLPAPLDCMSNSSVQESCFERWDHIRSILLRRIVERGTFGFILFRRALSILSKAIILKCEQHDAFEWAAPLSASAWPTATDAPKDDERCLLRAADIAAILLSDYGVQLHEGDLKLIAKTFAVQCNDSNDGHRDYVDGDRFADALRGEPSPKRHRCLLSLYAQLQKDAGLDDQGCLDSEWLARRLWDCRPKENPGVELPPFTPDELLGTLPLLCSHPLLSRAAFLRCAADLAFNVASHADFEIFIRSTWGITQLEM